MGGKFHLKLNIGERPIANKYREGKMKRTLKRELKVLEIAKREALKTSDTWCQSLVAPLVCVRQWATLRAFSEMVVAGLWCHVSQDQFDIVGEGGEEGRWAITVISLLLYLGLDWGSNGAPLAAWSCVSIALFALIAMLSLWKLAILGVCDPLCHHDLVRNGFYRPVLKHGPRSLTSMQVFEWKTLMRNESKGRLVSSKVGNRLRWHYRPIVACERFE